MGIEEDLSNVLKHINIGGGKLPFDSMLKSLMSTVEITALKQFQVKLAKMQEDLNKRISELSVTVPGERSMDPFTILGVSSSATKKEVEKAYRQKAYRTHPDRGGTDEEMALVNAAYEAIKRFKNWK